MSTNIETAHSQIETDLAKQADKSLLRFITCGSADDGKSTLIGRLLYEANMLLDDQISNLQSESERIGTQNGELDFALLVDGLTVEREQGITIDVAYRYFSTDRRKFIVADTPAHEQYARNIATGASTADLAIILVDARTGVLTQTCRHSFIVSLLGIRNVVLAINKMDLMNYDQKIFDAIVSDYRELVVQLEGIQHVEVIPVSALRGDNIVEPSSKMDWYKGPSMMEYLHAVEVESQLVELPFSMPVQMVNRPNSDFRWFSGQISSGRLFRGDAIRVLPGGTQAHIERIVAMDGDLEEALAAQSVTVTLDREIDVSRGDVIAAAEDAPGVADQFETTIIWMSETPLLSGRRYAIKIGTLNGRATVTKIKHSINVNSMERVAAKQLEQNEIAECNISVDRPVPFRPYGENKELGGFILIDQMTNETVGMGLINFALRRADNVHMQSLTVDRNRRAELKDQKPAVLWFTGLSGSGKSTIANILEQRLADRGHHTVLLDGDNVRHGLNRDLGFTDADRVENIRRIGEVAKLMADAGLLVLVSFISPFTAERMMARDILPQGEFIEIHVDTPLEVAEERDVKGLYRKARAGEIKNFTGIDSPYEVPENPEIVVDTSTHSAEEAADTVESYLKENGFLNHYRLAPVDLPECFSRY